MAIPTWLDAASEDARCALLGGGTAVAATVAANSVMTGNVWGVVGGGASTLAFTALGRLTGCAADPGTPSIPGGGGDIWNIGCREVDGCGDFRMRDINGTEYTIAERIKSFSSAGRDPDGWPQFSVNNCSGGSSAVSGGAPGFIVAYYITPDEDSECTDTGGPEGPGTETEPDKDPIGAPFTYTDPSGCDWTITANNSYIGQDGLPRIKYKAESDDPENCGGPYEWWQNPSGPIVPIGPNPDPDGDGTDLAPSLDQIRRELEEIKKKLNEMECEEPELEGTTYTLKGVCEYDENCKPVERETSVNTSGGKASVALASRLDALEKLLQAHKNYGQPGCNCKPCLEGEWRSIGFISDEASPASGDRVRKLFRYRSKSSTDLGGLIDHWKGFVWSAGPVIVSHKGGWWGTPQVWASSESEGKRVIQHAATEAGIDLSQVGEWVITTPRGTRTGVPGTCLLYTSPSPRDGLLSRMPSSA